YHFSDAIVSTKVCEISSHNSEFLYFSGQVMILSCRILLNYNVYSFINVHALKIIFHTCKSVGFYEGFRQKNISQHLVVCVKTQVYSKPHNSFTRIDFRQMQREAIETIIASKDSLVLLPTGSVVITPLLSLLSDQVQLLYELEN
ncbi:Hypothetical predicted protein, partial [Paramuricea clavata]